MKETTIIRQSVGVGLLDLHLKPLSKTVTIVVYVTSRVPLMTQLQLLLYKTYDVLTGKNPK